jgi:LuxR family maltose regulon positive regulatory protein
LEPALTVLERHYFDPVQQRLTPRERTVLQLAAEGLSGPAIAERLGVSYGTVRIHFGHIYVKLEVGGRGGAVAKGMRLGMIS